jgi:FecR protein
VASVSEKRKPGVYIAWKTVTYRSVLLALVVVALAFGAAMHFAFPQFTDSTVKAASNMTTNVLERIAGMAPPANSSSGSERQARFTALDGTVKIKKSSSSTWMTAAYDVPLEKGDVVQTGSEGMAKVVFNDGTNYTVKQDSLIVIEENSANDQQQTNVAVAVSTGTVDLSTAAYAQGSKSQVIVAGATASLGPESAAMVHNDPKSDQHEILVKKGSGEVARNGETVRLSDWERATFKAQSDKISKIKEIGPPTPISPANMMPLFTT